MGVVDEFVRQEGVQQRLDRRVGRSRIEQIDALESDHVLVGSVVERAQLAQRREPHRGKPGGSILPMSQPEPLTQITSHISPSRSFILVLTEVLPPPCSTSFGSPPSSRVV